MPLDFDKIKRDYPLPEIVGQSGVKLSKDGNEYRAICPFHAEKTESFTLYRAKDGVWKYYCFGCGCHGDNVDYVQERYGCKDAGEAARHITGDTKLEPLSTIEYREVTNPYDGYEIMRPPASAPPIVAGKRTVQLLNPKRVDPRSGKPKTVTYQPTFAHPYLTRAGELIGYVLRVDFDDRKITPGVWWTKNSAAKFEGWSHGSYPAPRPMYGLQALDKHPDWQILLVEGEKCKDAADRIMAARRIIPLTWMGGGKSLSKTHWKSLAGRSVLIWPDNDAEGWRTTLGYINQHGQWTKGLVEYAYEAGATAVKIVHITRHAKPEGWDIADAEAEGLEPAAIHAIIRDRVRDWTRERFYQWRDREIAKAQVIPEQPQEEPEPEPEQAPPIEPAEIEQPEPAPAPEPQHYAVGRGFQVDEGTWRTHVIMTKDGDGLKGNSLQNTALFLQYDPRFSGVFAWNDFAKEVYLMRRPPWDISGPQNYWKARKITDPDVTSAACFLEYCGLSPKINDVGRVIARVAQHNVYNPVAERIAELRWDGVPRLSRGPDTAPWLTHYMGAEDTVENNAFGRKWMIGAIARALDPGCKMDTMLVLEGPQGLKKSTALRVLSDAVVKEVFTDEISDPNSKDAALQMQGKWIIEIAELDAFRRADITAIKAWLTRQEDRFRRPYGKIVEDFPRACVFAGTVNPIGIGYLKDPSGGRRFWPFACGYINLDALKSDAVQLWAEAAQAYQDGEQWWLDEEETKHATAAQKSRYEEDPYGQMIDEYTRHHTRVTTMAIMGYLDIPKERRNNIALNRITRHLHTRGWIRAIGEDGQVHYDRPGEETLV